MTAFRAAFEPLTLTIERVIAEDGQVLMRSNFAATFACEFMGLAPIRKQVA